MLSGWANGKLLTHADIMKHKSEVPSKYQVTDIVRLNLDERKSIMGHVVGVKFSGDEIFYDIAVPVCSSLDGNHDLSFNDVFCVIENLSLPEIGLSFDPEDNTPPRLYVV